MRKLLFTFVLWTSAFAACSKAGYPPDFDALNREMADAGPKAFTIAEFSKSPMFVKLLHSGDHSIFTAMAHKPEMGLVSAAGVLALREKFPNDAYSSAMAALAEAQHPYDATWGFIVTYLKESTPPPDSEFKAEFEKLLATRFSSRTGLVMLVQTLPVASLETWLRSPSKSRTASNECVVVSRLYGELKTRPDWLVDKLASYKDETGPALATYLYYADVPADDLKLKLESALRDTTLENWEIEALSRKYRNFISDNIDVYSLGMEPTRTALVKRILGAGAAK